jgi:hypothetical protein
LLIFISSLIGSKTRLNQSVIGGLVSLGAATFSADPSVTVAGSTREQASASRLLNAYPRTIT